MPLHIMDSNNDNDSFNGNFSTQPTKREGTRIHRWKLRDITNIKPDFLVSDKIISKAVPQSLVVPISIPCQRSLDTPSTVRMASPLFSGSPHLSEFETDDDVRVPPSTIILYEHHHHNVDEATMKLVIPSGNDYNDDERNKKKRKAVELTMINKSNQHTRRSEKEPLVVGKRLPLSEHQHQQRQRQRQHEWIAILSLLATIFIIVLIFV
mmetsp:Transcript_18165/g.20986  ORF Transcript_18165/g.20986 Transcript_18165/m.20986 type:complete len:209 (-) Transcript_18165:104-730(-)|eukprot:CAMPEP_0170813038 /NCGR_PEP_ID=MMETSP0733-20121128/36501_1 /TAXON_ID=186038 /ORGANISM="Fragilariopsis kerguelensis, Strain L26-C5" /LENGTH=208 /DNA_ID=CAMNT_0011170081 /DNA_START=50 /DNA_END=676 /DNA_ORIENTATION=-